MGVSMTVKEGDTWPPLVYRLRGESDPLVPRDTPPPADLTGVQQVLAVFVRYRSGETIHSAICTVSDAVNGVVTTPLAEAVTDIAGLVWFEFVVTWSDGTESTYPAHSNTANNYLLVRAGLDMADSVPVGPASPPTGIDDEIGEGASLPTGGGGFELFRLIGNATLPNGLYRWDVPGGWVHVG